MLNIAAVGAMTMSLLAGPTVGAGAAHSVPAKVPPGRITVSVVTVLGTGCPMHTAAVAAAADNTAFTVTYSAFTAMAGPGAQPTDSRKNCQIAVEVNYPQGFTFAIAQVDYRGFADLAASDVGTEQANYYFQGDSETAHVSHRFNGPRRAGWQATDATTLASLVWAPCGERRDVNINAELRVDKGTASPRKQSSMTMDSTDGSIKNLYHLAWKTC
jgi:hypothetical protein